MMARRNFLKFHRENPEVMRLLVKFARRARARGHKRYSIRALAHRVRWETDVETRDPSGFKLNNNYLSFYSRKIEQDHPDLAGFLVKR